MRERKNNTGMLMGKNWRPKKPSNNQREIIDTSEGLDGKIINHSTPASFFFFCVRQKGRGGGRREERRQEERKRERERQRERMND